jgi:hypothetical protein
MMRCPNCLTGYSGRVSHDMNGQLAREKHVSELPVCAYVICHYCGYVSQWTGSRLKLIPPETCKERFNPEAYQQLYVSARARHVELARFGWHARIRLN